MEIMPRHQRPRTLEALHMLVVNGTWLRNEETGQVFRLIKLKDIVTLQTYCLCNKSNEGSISMIDVLVFPSYDGIHIIEPDYSKKNFGSPLPHAVKHQWVPFSQLEIIISL